MAGLNFQTVQNMLMLLKAECFRGLKIPGDGFLEYVPR